MEEYHQRKQENYKKQCLQYKMFLEKDRKRQERNENMVRNLERIESKIVLLSAKTERLNNLKRQYEYYLREVDTFKAIPICTDKRNTTLPPKTQYSITSDIPEHSRQNRVKEPSKTLQDRDRSIAQKLDILGRYLKNSHHSEDTFNEPNKDDSECTLKGNIYPPSTSNEFKREYETVPLADDIMNSLQSRYYNRSQILLRGESNLPTTLLRPDVKLKQSLKKDINILNTNDDKSDQVKDTTISAIENLVDKTVDIVCFKKPNSEINIEEQILSKDAKQNNNSNIKNAKFLEETVKKNKMPEKELDDSEMVLNTLENNNDIETINSEKTSELIVKPDDIPQNDSTKQSTNENEKKKANDETNVLKSETIQNDYIQLNSDNNAATINTSIEPELLNNNKIQLEEDAAKENIQTEAPNTGPLDILETTEIQQDQIENSYDLQNQMYVDQVEPIKYEYNQYDEYGQPLLYNQQGQLVQPEYDEQGQIIPQYDENQEIMVLYNHEGVQIYPYLTDENYYASEHQYDENGQIVSGDQNYENYPQYDTGFQNSQDDQANPNYAYDAQYCAPGDIKVNQEQFLPLPESAIVQDNDQKNTNYDYDNTQYIAPGYSQEDKDKSFPTEESTVVKDNDQINTNYDTYAQYITTEDVQGEKDKLLPTQEAASVDENAYEEQEINNSSNAKEVIKSDLDSSNKTNLDTDTESSVKQNISEVSNNSDFDFN